MLYPLADTDVLLEHVAGDGGHQAQGVPSAVLGESQLLTALGGLGSGVGGIGPAGLEA